MTQVQVFDASPDRSGGYKVDVGRGQRVGRVSSEWFSNRSDRVLSLVEGFVPEVRWLDDAETLTYLHSTISTRRQSVRVRTNLPRGITNRDSRSDDHAMRGGGKYRRARAVSRLQTANVTPRSRTTD